MPKRLERDKAKKEAFKNKMFNSNFLLWSLLPIQLGTTCFKKASSSFEADCLLKEFFSQKGSIVPKKTTTSTRSNQNNEPVKKPNKEQWQRRRQRRSTRSKQKFYTNKTSQHPYIYIYLTSQYHKRSVNPLWPCVSVCQKKQRRGTLWSRLQTLHTLQNFTPVSRPASKVPPGGCNDRAGLRPTALERVKIGAVGSRVAPQSPRPEDGSWRRVVHLLDCGQQGGLGSSQCPAQARSVSPRRGLQQLFFFFTTHAAFMIISHPTLTGSLV